MNLANEQRKRMVEGGTLRWSHWVVVLLSLGLTISAWWIAKNSVQDKAEIRFDQEADRVEALVAERMLKYEDALWGGVGVVRTQTHGLSDDEWRTYAETININIKYPGILGVGVIEHVPRDHVDRYLAERHKEQPGYRVFPPHDEPELMPIRYIEPVAQNSKAVGLDIAHEANRYNAAKQARDTGKPQLTGPIVLVQDAKKTAGFLFFIPFYRNGPADSVDATLPPTTVEARRERFAGMVYAPFITSSLMDGVLGRDNRLVDIRITDDAERIFEDDAAQEGERDPSPMFTRTADLSLYGRTWHVEVDSSMTFRASVGSIQPIAILVAGIGIDCLLLALFISISRANRRAIELVDLTSKELEEKLEDLAQSNIQLAQSNQDLEQFAYVASHDLQEPLRMVGSYCDLISKRYADKLDEKGLKFLEFAVDGATRMRALINGLLLYARVAQNEQAGEHVDCDKVMRTVLHDLEAVIEEAQATITVGELPTVFGNTAQLGQVFQNLLTNAIKFRGDAAPEIKVAAERQDDGWIISVSDNGIGMKPEYIPKIFLIFQRLNTRQEFPGSGVGLAVVKRIVERNGGTIRVESEPGVGTTFYVELKISKAESGTMRKISAMAV